MTCVRGLVEAIYVESEQLFKSKLNWFTYMFLVPFLLNFFLSHYRVTNIVLLSTSALTLLGFLINDIIQIKYHGLWPYLTLNSFVSLSLLPIHIACALLGWSVRSKEGAADFSMDMVVSEKATYNFLLLVEVFFAFFRLFYMLRVYEKYVHLIRVVKKALSDIQKFTMFFLTCIIFVSILLMMSGV